MKKINFETLKRKRLEAGLRQEDMAELLGYAGVQGYGRIETSSKDLSLSRAKAIADIFNCSIEEIFFNE